MCNLAQLKRWCCLLCFFSIGYVGPVMASTVDLVYLGGADCPYCRSWEAYDLPKLQASPTFKKIRFSKVDKVIKSPVPSAFWFPKEIKHLRDPIAEKLKGWGSPMFAIVNDGKVIAAWTGTRKSTDEILSILEEQSR